MKKIMHICLTGPYNDGWGYQENLLPKYHKKMGYDVMVLASEWVSDENKQSIVVNSVYEDINGVYIKRLKFNCFTTKKTKIKFFIGIYNSICNYDPDILFIHDCQILQMAQIVKFIKVKKQISVYVDCHTDFMNSARNWLSKNILHRFIWKYFAQMIEPYATKFYGVLPARVEFLKHMYRIPSLKIFLLPMGVDSDYLNLKEASSVRARIREKYNIGNSDILLITGGKIDSNKIQVENLLSAISQLPPNVKLIIFGTITSENAEKIKERIDNYKIIFIGWLEAKSVYDYFLASDIAIFPGLHSVLWEQAAGSGIPCVFNYIEGMTHVDVGGNCKFLYNDTQEEIVKLITLIINDYDLYQNMLMVARETAVKYFSYTKIAEMSLDV